MYEHTWLLLLLTMLRLLCTGNQQLYILYIQYLSSPCEMNHLGASFPRPVYKLSGTVEVQL